MFELFVLLGGFLLEAFLGLIIMGKVDKFLRKSDR